jgi:hypothetical protein
MGARPGFARHSGLVSEWYRYQDELLGRILTDRTPQRFSTWPASSA